MEYKLFRSVEHLLDGFQKVRPMHNIYKFRNLRFVVAAQLIVLAIQACGQADSARSVPYPEDRYVVVNGARLHYLDWGGEGQPLLWVHGFTTTAHDSGPIAPALVERYRVLALTRRGHGSSDPAPDSFDVDLNVDDLAAFIRTFVDEPVVLVGMSHGGMEISRLTRRYPELVRGLIYLDGIFDWQTLSDFPPLPGFDLDSLFTSFEALDKAQATLFPEFWGKDLQRSVHSQVLKRSDGQIAWQLSPNGNAFARYIQFWDEWDASDYDAIDFPVLVLLAHRGDYWLENLKSRGFSTQDLEIARIAKQYDEDNKRRGLELLLAAVHEAEVVEFEATAHVLHFHRPAEVSRRITEFLARQLDN